MTSKTLKWRIPLIAVVCAVSLYLVHPPFDTDGEGPKTGKLKLGLDLQGGMHLVLRVATETLPEKQRDGATDRAVEIIRNRIDQFGVSEPSIQRQGVNEIVVQLPGITDRERALSLIGKTALMEFRLVSEKTVASGTKEAPAGTKFYKQKEGGELLLENEVLLQGKSLTDATVNYSRDLNAPGVSITFDAEGAKKFADITSRYVGRRLAIVLDDIVQSAPNIKEPIPTGEGHISGAFSTKEAADLAISLRAGALPAPIHIEEERTVGPTLGKDSITQGVHSTIAAAAFVSVFMLIYYLMGGFIANVALILNVILIGAFLAYFRATLTLPGIAGMILTIGMAVDTNVLLMERIREEIHLGKPVKTAIDIGYKRAFSAILDTHMTTIITALILYHFGIGPMRGFALTLGIGIVCSFFTGIFVTRTIFDIFTSLKNFKSLPMFSFLKHTPNIPFLEFRKFLLTGSAIVVLMSVFLIFTRVSSSFGIDFTGGILQQYHFEKQVEVQDIRKALAEVGLSTAIIQRFGETSDVVVRTPDGTKQKVDDVIDRDFKDNKHQIVRIESVGPIVGKELKKKSLWAIGFSLLSILVYLAFRFELRYSCAAIVALFHDVIVCLGALMLTGRELSVPVLAALLTIVGYSVNDTIITFDRARENLKKKNKMTLLQVMDLSINETLARTILTSFTTFLTVLALFLFGGPVLQDFAFTMMVGIITGTYSSFSLAAPIVVDWPAKKLK